ncbi:spore germination protein [Halalkalibacterium halodurans]|uniref:spore germination protein n=1 Tax=Halalkalibacterium halodurans TaxID=86665 RepID=UPI0006A9849B|nr:spore germination protein [Halalkalibacterium halodurans]TPE67896.1 spore germination protein [Halalkalibacterium halodurans]
MRRTKGLSSIVKRKRPIDQVHEVNHIRENEMLSESLEENKKKIKELLGNSSDLVIRELMIIHEPEISGVAVFINGLADEQLVSECIVSATLHPSKEAHYFKEDTKDKRLSIIETQILSVARVQAYDLWSPIIHSLLSGNSIVLIDGFDKALSCSTPGSKWRSIEEPSTETTVRGPKDAFNESLQTNLSLIRRRVKSNRLRVENTELGETTHTDVALVYVDDLVDKKLLQEIKQRLNRVITHKVISEANIEEAMQDEMLTPFPTIYNTERPDMVAYALVEEKVALIIDGTPFALILPTDFAQFFKAAEDYYQRYDLSTFIRLLRYFAFTVSLLGPSLYVALITFHQDLIPTTLLIRLASQREGIPFPALVEALIMEFTFELLREAGLRMPRAIGQAVSIVGALVIGQAAVQAGIVSASMVIVVAATGIASFTTPAYNLAVAARLLRFFMMLLAATFGLYGIILGLIMLVAHLSSLRSVGMPYFAPFAPFSMKAQKDGLFRLPLKWLDKRHVEDKNS